MFGKVALISCSLILVGSPWAANSDQAPPLTKVSNKFHRECQLVLKSKPTGWLERLKAGRCGAWREVRDWTEERMMDRM